MTTLSLIPIEPEDRVPQGGITSASGNKNKEVRCGEESKTWYRTDRIYENNGAWFFATRENIYVGPYTSKDEAEIDIRLLVTSLKETKSEEEAILVIQEFNTRERLQLRRTKQAEYSLR